MANASQRAVYPNLTATQQRQIRDSVFEDLATIQSRIAGPLSQVTGFTDEVANLAAFVAANVADFTADGTLPELAAARNNVRDVVVSAVDGINGISATRP